MLLVAAEGNRPVRRRYTIRQLDEAARLLTLDIVLHGHGPGERWVRSARSGDKIEGIGPRGKITTSATADWHLFIGDESALPAAFAIPGALPLRLADGGDGRGDLRVDLCHDREPGAAPADRAAERGGVVGRVRPNHDRPALTEFATS